ncbi:hypothetical protein ACFVH6_23465 [Spirillospora sp. NPDC127200]
MATSDAPHNTPNAAPNAARTLSGEAAVMAAYDDHLRTCRDDAHDARVSAEVRLDECFRDGGFNRREIAETMRAVAVAQSFAAWWDEVIIGIDGEDHTAPNALTRTRRDARTALAGPPSPVPPPSSGGAAAFEWALTVAEADGARMFYDHTADLDTAPCGDTGCPHHDQAAARAIARGASGKRPTLPSGLTP